DEEKVTIDFAFATVCSISDIKKGDVFTKDNIWVKRPGTGEILAEEFDSIIGRSAKHDVKNDQQLTWNDIE
ncbi:MAG: polyhydroxyalkanoate biosynthesis repressor PhaR, partial [Flavobacteriaceae bacterium]|nr:polyhydroxyalkanoate biosynthesis repressor PhaR [Bacteroidia bacterium]NNL61582.1 polyhydroxyalkanoate biosynthesis repressor PhaR [Flavobacteriaceae bacterium]